MPANRYTDQIEREVDIPTPPGRIVSLVPSQTEFLIDIGAPVVGRTKFCIHPKEQVTPIPVVGGTKKFNFEKIQALSPDLIIGNKEENYQEGIEALEKEYTVWMSDIYSLEDAFSMMSRIGEFCHLKEKADQVVQKCREATAQIKGTQTGKVIYLIWTNPWMAAGKNTFIDHMLTHQGYENLITDERYPVLTNEEIAALNPDRILFSSEPYPFKKKHLSNAQSIWPEAKCELVDGELYSWYGSRLSRWV